MGALCGKESKDDNFTGPGRRLDSPPAERTTAPLPSNKRIVGGSPRTLGGSSPAIVGGSPRTLGGSSPATGSGGGGDRSPAADDARQRAADAAEARLKAKNDKAGKLGTALLQQKKQTMNETMKQAAGDEARRKEIETADQQLNYN